MLETLHKSKQISVIALDRIGDYLELMRIELKLQGQEIAMHIMGYAIAAFFAFLASVFVGLAIIVTFWDTDFRGLAAWGVVALYLAGAGVGIYLTRKQKLEQPAFSTLREELKRDVDLVKESL